jgi:peroxiredoxin Q/BCP
VSLELQNCLEGVASFLFSVKNETIHFFLRKIMAKNLVGKKCPAFKADATSDQIVENSSFKGMNLVIYFYPKDSTPGCTTEGQEFRDSYKLFKKMNTEILGVSRESIKSHEKFKSNQSFPFELLSDPDEIVCKAFDVMKLKSMYGKEYMGVDRSTFIIDSSGKIRKEWRGVKVKGHVQEVLEAIKELTS